MSTGRVIVSKLAAIIGAISVLSGTGIPAMAQRTTTPVEIGNRVEMFVDRWMIDALTDTMLQATPPERREVVITTDRPWEGPSSAYFSAIQDGKKVRLYYRGFCPEDASGKQVTCMAESEDGVHFIRPALGLFSFDGSRQNNIIWQGVESHNFGPFLDANPNCKQEARYKALAGINSKLYAFQSADGIHWTKIRSEPVITDGAFDSLNTAFWDGTIQKYRCYSRYWDAKGSVRAIQYCTSADFLTWSKPAPNRYASDAPQEHFYTNATRPCPGAEHQLLSFPKRFVPERTRRDGYKDPGVSDAVFMSSRDGERWDRSFLEAWVRPGLDERNWTQRSNMPAAGIVSIDPNEFTMYISRHYQWPDNGLQRITIRKFGFASVHAGRTGGSFLTRAFTVRGRDLLLNMATSAAGSVKVEVLTGDGDPIEGFRLKDSPTLFGDDLSRKVVWSGGKDLSGFIGKIVRLNVEMHDADVYAMQIGK